MNNTNLYMWSFGAGIFIYLLLEIDRRHFNLTDDSRKYSSLRIAMMVSVLVWLLYVYYLNDLFVSCSKVYDKIQIRDDPF